MMGKAAEKETVLVRLQHQMQQDRASTNLELQRLTNEVALWRNAVVAGGTAAAPRIADASLASAQAEHGGALGNELETLAKLGSQWATTCSILADIPLHARGQAALVRSSGKGRTSGVSALVVAAARELVRDVTELQQGCLLTISDLRMAVCSERQRIDAQADMLRKQHEKMLHETFDRTQSKLEELATELSRDVEVQKVQVQREKEGRFLAETALAAANARLDSMQRERERDKAREEAREQERLQDQARLVHLQELLRAKKSDLKNMRKVCVSGCLRRVSECCQIRWAQGIVVTSVCLRTHGCACISLSWSVV